MLVSLLLIIYFRDLLQSNWPLNGYFSAEIIAHLAYEQSWDTVSTENGKAEVLEELQNSIKNYIPLDEISIKYICIENLIVLLNSKNTPCLLWAVYAVLNICSINGKFI